MHEIHYLSEEHLLVFLTQIFVLLAGAKIMGSLCRRWGYPELAGEILAGILLGPTILGRISPETYAGLFPGGILQQNMLETVSWLGVLFLLLATGFEVSLSTVWRQGRAALLVGVIGVIVPLAIGAAVFYWLPDRLWGPNADRLTFTLFLATAASISALSVIARVLHDLEILRTDLGLMTLSGFVVNDLLGWLVFTLVLSLSARHHAVGAGTMRAFFEILLFGTVCLTVGSRLVGVITRALKRTSLPHPAATLSFIACLALLCGAITQWIGIHAILGFFLAGIMAGNTGEISERTRDILSQMVHSVFVPLFFASIAVRIDFVSNFNLPLIAGFTAVAMGGKFIGAFAGARVAGLPGDDSLAVGVAFIPGGAMEIVIGMLALELGLITENVFVAVVFAALFSSIVVGPMLGWSLRRRKPVSIAGFITERGVIADLAARTKWDAIAELCRAAAGAAQGTDIDSIIAAVRQREEVMGTALEQGIAVPHARLAELKAPIIAFGRSLRGIDWDARDGLATNHVFLVLTPEGKQDIQVQILAAIARHMLDADIRNRVMTASDSGVLLEALRTVFAGQPQEDKQNA